MDRPAVSIGRIFSTDRRRRPFRPAIRSAEAMFADDRTGATMKIYVLSLGAGLLVGVIYSLLGVRSPAPPMIALIGLLGILVGEQVIPVGRQMLSGTTLSAAWHSAGCASHLFGLLPGRHADTVSSNSVAAKETRS